MAHAEDASEIVLLTTGSTSAFLDLVRTPVEIEAQRFGYRCTYFDLNTRAHELVKYCADKHVVWLLCLDDLSDNVARFIPGMEDLCPEIAKPEIERHIRRIARSVQPDVTDPNIWDYSNKPVYMQSLKRHGVDAGVFAILDTKKSEEENLASILPVVEDARRRRRNVVVKRPYTSGGNGVVRFALRDSDDPLEEAARLLSRIGESMNYGHITVMTEFKFSTEINLFVLVGPRSEMAGESTVEVLQTHMRKVNERIITDDMRHRVLQIATKIGNLCRSWYMDEFYGPEASGLVRIDFMFDCDREDCSDIRPILLEITNNPTMQATAEKLFLKSNNQLAIARHIVSRIVGEGAVPVETTSRMSRRRHDSHQAALAPPPQPTKARRRLAAIRDEEERDEMAEKRFRTPDSF